jgi:PiT family inorganic phosphate transporter
MMAAVLNFAGAMISTKVATTIGKGIVDALLTQMVIAGGYSGRLSGT